MSPQVLGVGREDHTGAGLGVDEHAEEQGGDGGKDDEDQRARTADVDGYVVLL